MKVGEQHTIFKDIPSVGEIFEHHPQSVINSRVGKEKSEVLVVWQGLLPAEATWEDPQVIQEHFPELTLEDKGVA